MYIDDGVFLFMILGLEGFEEEEETSLKIGGYERILSI